MLYSLAKSGGGRIALLVDLVGILPRGGVD